MQWHFQAHMCGHLHISAYLQQFLHTQHAIKLFNSSVYSVLHQRLLISFLHFKNNFFAYFEWAKLCIFGIIINIYILKKICTVSRCPCVALCCDLIASS